MKPGKIISLSILFTIFNFYPAPAQVLQQDSLALVAFYNSTGGLNWNNNSGWLTGPVNTWYGITVEGERVVELIINSNNLAGTLPNDLGQLTALVSLGMSNDQELSGELPESLFQITSLKWFGIGNCSLTGIIPNNIGNCSSLFEFSLPQNNLTGPIPPEIGNLDSLIFLDLHNNQLTGSIPPELGNCANLWELRLNNNQLTGTIPIELTYFEDLYTFNLGNNQLSSEVPEYLSNLFFQTMSIEINLAHNQFSGAVPESWGNLSFLIDGLNLSYNNFTSLPAVNYNWIITFFNIEGNKLTFEHIESHYLSYLQGLYYFFDYYYQDDMLEEIDTALVPGNNYSIYSGTGGEFTNYKWYRNGELILESIEADTLFLENISYADTGVYTCTADNSLIYFVNLHRRPVHITIDTGTNIIVQTGIKKEINIYPNPATDNINIAAIGFKGNLNLTIYDIKGREIISSTVYLNKYGQKDEVDISSLEQGIYIVEVRNSIENFTEKLIINKRGIHR